MIDMIEDDLNGNEDMPDDDLAPPAYVKSPPRSRRSSDDLTACTVRLSSRVCPWPALGECVISLELRS
jgi:hypothetical protein